MLDNLQKYKVVLASNSPRRQELLKSLNIDFEVLVKSGIEEDFPESLKKKEVAEYLAVKKAQAYTDEIKSNHLLLITADPERDTPEVLKVYAPFFHPGITGATGSPEQIAEIARRYGVVYMKQKPVDDRPYAVDHSSFTYLIDLAGKLDTILPHATPAPEIVAAIRRNLDKPAQ